jgi:sporulation protein YlmC with PRC-barrel domain
MHNQIGGTAATGAATGQAVIGAADKVVGTRVFNTAGEHLGEIHDIILDKVSGKVVYAVMSFGGFLGIGERYHPLPWQTLKYDRQVGGYVVPLTRERLENAPTYGTDGEPDWTDSRFGKSIFDYYGAGPYLM